ncbi:hypothetical protein BLA24_12795 [Streptomyces cinnamoneus]|uniref:Heparin binding hemagglutinin HbhA n=1 Tax=Streptomyces cinnamoneus TaxID=53446 RepID=A0A2G1XK03_STRCJ|nr:hypothetical protein [Streptomyces cinnamoneus]PHQ51573.1 hypothetical protein BLA24_12795 [Streptomyces cinnamoneus]PPT14365.1 hypothetical protein CYQ11_17150 [Streptomyces cinnamoneus]
MALTQDIRKAATDTGYAVAGAADLTAEKIGQFVTDAPELIDQLRKTDPKALGARVTQQAKVVQTQVTTKVTALVGTLDTDVRKIGQTAQDLALQGVGQAVGYAAKAGEAFDKLSERGREAVKTWQGRAAEEITEIAVAVEPDHEQPAAKTGQQNAQAADAKDSKDAKAEADTDKPAAARRGTTATRKPAAKKADAKGDDA